MNDINNIILESFTNHFKKHWKKYALGLGSAALAGGAIYTNKDKINKTLGLSKPKLSLGKKIAIGAGVAGVVGAAHQGYHLAKANKEYSQYQDALKKSQEAHIAFNKAKEDAEKATEKRLRFEKKASSVESKLQKKRDKNGDNISGQENLRYNKRHKSDGNDKFSEFMSLINDIGSNDDPRARSDKFNRRREQLVDNEHSYISNMNNAREIHQNLQDKTNAARKILMKRNENLLPFLRKNN